MLNDAADADEYDDVIDQMKQVRDGQAQALAAQVDDVDDADELLDDFSDADVDTVEVPVDDLARMLGDMELLLNQPVDPMEHLHRLDVMVRISEQNQDAIQGHLKDIVAQHGDPDPDDVGGMFR